MFDPGQRFAMMEEKVLLATLLRRFTLESIQSLEETKPAGAARATTAGKRDPHQATFPKIDGVNV